MNSRRSDAYRDRLRFSFFVLQALSQYPQGERLRLRHRLVRRASVCQHARKLRHLGHPAPVFLLFVLYREMHGVRHDAILRWLALRIIPVLTPNSEAVKLGGI